ncbi:MAG: SIS domain-containing protein, partial [Actinobacteria bacterium]|nr:SIS domain-containing protein [Actinomycetota bacterium]
ERSVYVMGNGGSAATASHMVCDLTKAAAMSGHGRLRLVALAENSALLTALANDLSYEETFAAQLAAQLLPDDLVIAISVSGRSRNIIAGLAAATAMGARTIAFLGMDGGEALGVVDAAFHVPSHDFGVVETVHLAVVHALAAALAAGGVGPSGQSAGMGSARPGASRVSGGGSSPA